MSEEVSETRDGVVGVLDKLALGSTSNVLEAAYRTGGGQRCATRTDLYTQSDSRPALRCTRWHKRSVALRPRWRCSRRGPPLLAKRSRDHSKDVSQSF